MNQITVATYNIRHGGDVNCVWPCLAAHVAAVGADLLGLQEVDVGTRRTGGADGVAGLVEATGLPHTLYVPTMPFDGGEYGTAILSRYPFAEAGKAYPLPSAHYEPRAFGCVTVTPGDGTRVAFLNTHLSVESADQRVIQTKYLAHWMDAHIPADIPCILTGDFNTEDMAAFSPLTARGFIPVNNPETRYPTFYATGVAIDNILYRGDNLRLQSAGMVESRDSDHNLLWATLALA